MISYNKEEVKNKLTNQNIFDLLVEWGGNPSRHPSWFISDTICHNKPGQGSHKLYYYFNTKLFRCFTGGCEEPYFDIFELYRKIIHNQENRELDLNGAVRGLAEKFNIEGTWEDAEDDKLEDWKAYADYSRIESLEPREYKISLKEYDKNILDRFNYKVRLRPWELDGISPEVMRRARIGYYPGGDQITIPHYDSDGRFIGLRGRTLCQEEAENYGKYRPIKIGLTLYNHPLGMNLYGLNWAKDNIRRFGRAIVFESEKSVLQYMTKFGFENSIAVACCGSTLSIFHIHQLLDCGATEITIAFDRQYKQVNDDEYLKWIKKLKSFYDKYSSLVLISFILDKQYILGYKDSPIETNKENFIELYNNRIVLDKSN